jgi:rod shape-determining protein MreD
MQTAVMGKQQLLPPAKGRFVLFTFVAALMFNLLPWQAVGLMLRPDMVALVLIYWCIHQPRMVGMGAAWLLGLMLDVADGMLLGQSALAYTLLAFAALLLRRRILQFPLGQQALHILPVLLLLQFAMLGIKLAAGNSFAGWGYFLASFTGALLWPVVASLLMLSQRREIKSEPTIQPGHK